MPDTDVLANVKREQEVADRPGKTAPTPVPSGLRNEYSDASYKMVKQPTAKPKSDEEKSLEWNKAQAKVVESQ